VIAVTPTDARYPARLRHLARPPDPLWVDGDETALAARSVAIVGTRRMTGYGERVAREIAGSCAGANVVVVSGLAQGIDSAAHRGALDAGGRSVAVLGEGITLFLATVRGRRRPLVPRIRASGALVSQYAPTFCAQPWAFAKRNATIAALAEAVVVVEAGQVSGALITADEARRLGRPLFAVPGPLGSAASVGTNALLAS
jgi:DNA processing protein